MKSTLIALLLITVVVLGPTVGSDSPQPGQEPSAHPTLLFKIETGASDVAHKRLIEKFPVVGTMRSGVLVKGSAADLQEAEELGFETLVIDENPHGALHFIVEGTAPSDRARLREEGEILYFDRGEAVVRSTREHHFCLNRRDPFMVRQVSRSRMRLPVKEQNYESMMPVVNDPIIQNMVNSVSVTNLQALVNTLVASNGTNTRHSSTSGGDWAEGFLFTEFSSYGISNVSLHAFPGGYSDNVIAEIPGSVFPEKIVVIGGHYDSSSFSGGAPGADDNATGTASVLEAARVFQAAVDGGAVFENTVRFCGWSAEEVGLVGSGYYAQDARDANEDIVGMVQLDMEGYLSSGDTLDLDITYNTASTGLFNLAWSSIQTYVPLLSLLDEFNCSVKYQSDHASFWSEGYPAIFFFEDCNSYSPYIHSDQDIVGVSYNNTTLHNRATRAAVATIGVLAVPFDGLSMAHTPLTDTNDETGPYTVTTTIISTNGLAAGYPKLHYSIDGGAFTVVTMTSIGSDQYQAGIPGQVYGTDIDYYIEAQDTLAATDFLPEDAPTSTYSFTIVDFIWADDMESGTNGWTHGGTEDDWQYGAPQGSAGDPGSAFSGTSVWGNDLGPSGWNGEYRANANNWLQSPSIDCTGYSDVSLTFYRWLGVEDGIYDQARVRVNGTQFYVNPSGGGSSHTIDSSWVFQSIDISSVADDNSSVVIRFELQSDGGVEYGGWNIDNVALVGTAGTQPVGEIQAVVDTVDDVVIPGKYFDYTVTYTNIGEASMDFRADVDAILYNGTLARNVFPVAGEANPHYTLAPDEDVVISESYRIPSQNTGIFQALQEAPLRVRAHVRSTLDLPLSLDEEAFLLTARDVSSQVHLFEDDRDRDSSGFATDSQTSPNTPSVAGDYYAARYRVHDGARSLASLAGFEIGIADSGSSLATVMVTRESGGLPDFGNVICSSVVDPGLPGFGDNLVSQPCSSAAVTAGEYLWLVVTFPAGGSVVVGMDTDGPSFRNSYYQDGNSPGTWLPLTGNMVGGLTIDDPQPFHMSGTALGWKAFQEVSTR